MYTDYYLKGGKRSMQNNVSCKWVLVVTETVVDLTNV